MPDFLDDETGAITVDWVVLTAASRRAGPRGACRRRRRVAVGTPTGHLDGLRRRYRLVGGAPSDADLRAGRFRGRPRRTGSEAVRDVRGFRQDPVAFGRRRPRAIAHRRRHRPRFRSVEFDMIIADSWDDERGRFRINGADVLISRPTLAQQRPDVRPIARCRGTATVTLPAPAPAPAAPGEHDERLHLPGLALRRRTTDPT